MRLIEPDPAPSVPGLPAGRIGSVSKALLDYVGDARLQPGDRLPAERDLVKSLAAGRSTVREVIRRLQALGVLEARQGSGTYLRRVASANAIHLPLLIEATTLRDRLLQTLEVRRGLEVEASAAAARRATPADLKRIEAKLDAMEATHRATGGAGREDLAFHLAIYDATGNPLFRQLLGGMREGFERFFAEPFERPDFARRSFPFHRELFDAIRKGDEKKARKRTKQILAVVADDIRTMAR